jgi:hypothetical protein
MKTTLILYGILFLVLDVNVFLTLWLYDTVFGKRKNEWV